MCILLPCRGQDTPEFTAKKPKMEKSASAANGLSLMGSDSPFSDSDNMVAMTQLKEEVESLKKLVASKDLQILERDKKVKLSFACGRGLLKVQSVQSSQGIPAWILLPLYRYPPKQKANPLTTHNTSSFGFCHQITELKATHYEADKELRSKLTNMQKKHAQDLENLQVCTTSPSFTWET